MKEESVRFLHLLLFSTSISSCCFSFWVCVCVCVCVCVVVVMILFFIKTVVTSQEVLCKRWQLCIEEQLLGSSLVPHAGALARNVAHDIMALEVPPQAAKASSDHLDFISALSPRSCATSYVLRALFSSVQFSRSVVSLCNLMDCSTLSLPVHHQLPEFTQTRVHWVGDAIQPSHPLSFPSPPTFNLSQHQGLFKWVSSSH